MAIIGAGEQACLQLKALRLVRDIEHVTVWARDSKETQQFARDCESLPCDIADSVNQALRHADIAITTTPSREPLIHARDLHSGLHITAMGSDAEHKNEIAPDVFAKVRYVCDRLQQVRVLGELHHAIDAGVIVADATFTELGEVIAQKAPGRTNGDEVTVCDLTGTGAQDTAIATLAVQRARAAQAGTIFHNDVTA